MDQIYWYLMKVKMMNPNAVFYCIADETLEPGSLHTSENLWYSTTATDLPPLDLTEKHEIAIQEHSVFQVIISKGKDKLNVEHLNDILQTTFNEEISSKLNDVVLMLPVYRKTLSEDSTLIAIRIRLLTPAELTGYLIKYFTDSELFTKFLDKVSTLSKNNVN